MRHIKRIYIHTAAAGRNGKPVDQSAKTIRDYHVNNNGWSDIGYNLVIRFDGTVEAGRPESKTPAGVSGDNSNSLHICCTGHGDLADFTPAQKKACAIEVAKWLKKYKLKEAFMDGKPVVLGHAEYWKYVSPGPALKSCPGKKVDMDEIRSMVRDAVRGYDITPTNNPSEKVRVILNGFEVVGEVVNGQTILNLSESFKLHKDWKKTWNPKTKTSTYTIPNKEETN